MMQETVRKNTSYVTQKKYILLAFLFLLLCAVGISVFSSMQAYKSAEQEIVLDYEATLSKDARDAANAIVLWRDTVEAQAKRISSSELYRLFVSELNELDSTTISIVNEIEDTAALNSDIASLAEQIPLMRNVLLDFINFNGFTDARIINANGQNLLTVHTQPSANQPAQVKAVQDSINTSKMRIAPIRQTNLGITADIVDPLQAVMNDEEVKKPVAAILLTLPIAGQWGKFVSNDNISVDGATIHIIQKNGANFEEVKVQSISAISKVAAEALSFDDENAIPFEKRIALDGKSEVYSTGLEIEHTNFFVIIELPAKIITDSLDGELTSIIVVATLACLGFILVLPALWWFLVGRSQQAAAAHFEELYKTISKQKHFLDSINISLDIGLFMVDRDGIIDLCNRAFAEVLKDSEEKLTGKSLFMLFRDESSEKILEAVGKILRDGKTNSFEVEYHHQNETYLYRVTLFPFIDNDEGLINGAVGTMQDITEFRKRSIQDKRQQIQTITALTRAVEGVDPYLAGHSHKMKNLGLLIAENMKLTDADLQTISLAAELSQIGKLFLSHDILTKTGKLTDEELKEIKRVPEYSYNILKDINFEYPIASAVYEMNESMDGRGYPRHLQGDEINIHARILAVVNAFCALTSPRSYREGLSVDKAIEILSSGTSFDKNVINALNNVLSTVEGSSVLRLNKV